MEHVHLGMQGPRPREDMQGKASGIYWVTAQCISYCLKALAWGQGENNGAIYRDSSVSGMWFFIVPLLAEWRDVAMMRGEVKAHAAMWKSI